MPRRRVAKPSAPSTRLPGELNEAHFLEIDAVMLYLEEARRRTERAIEALRKDDAEPHLVEALEQAESELSAMARTLRHGTFFAVPKAQLSF